MINSVAVGGVAVGSPDDPGRPWRREICRVKLTLSIFIADLCSKGHHALAAGSADAPDPGTGSTGGDRHLQEKLG
jgi:hypothetical protein